jgi:hypothetical protein
MLAIEIGKRLPILRITAASTTAVSACRSTWSAGRVTVVTRVVSNRWGTSLPMSSMAH